MTELQKHSLVIGARKRRYFVLYMPLTMDGNGPAEAHEYHKPSWEVWDQVCDSFGSFEYLPDAIDEAERLNVEWDEANGR